VILLASNPPLAEFCFAFPRNGILQNRGGFRSQIAALQARNFGLLLYSFSASLAAGMVSPGFGESGFTGRKVILSVLVTILGLFFIDRVAQAWTLQ